jgi:hypothetical protein
MFRKDVVGEMPEFIIQELLLPREASLRGRILNAKFV